MTSDPRPPKRYKATANEWEWFRLWFKDERCWVCDGEWANLHHILPKSHGGDDDIVNLAPLCGSGTTGCHGRIEARDPVARAALRGAFLPSNYEYFVRKLGDKAEGWIERNYAPRKVAA